MRIAYVTETFLPSIDGVVTRITHGLDYLADAGHDVMIICPDLGVHEYKGFPVVGIKAIRYPIYHSRPWGTPSGKIVKALDAFKPDIVHVWHPALIGVRAVPHLVHTGVPLITSYHTNVVRYLDYYGPARILKHPLVRTMRWLNNSSPITLVTSQAMKTALGEQGFAGLRVLPRGVDLSARDPRFASLQMRERLSGGRPDNPLLVFVGRIAAEKSLDTLEPMMRKHPEWSLAFVGDGPDRARLEQLFEGTHTTFSGFLQGDELSSAFASADAFVFPSTTETLGLVLLEAMASGVPVVAASSPATDEQIKTEVNGIVYDAQDPQALTGSVERLLADPGLAEHLKAEGLKQARLCDWPHTSAALLDAYSDTVELYRQGWRSPSHPSRPQPLGQADNG